MQDSNLNGTLYRIKICDLAVAISCADCPTPFVKVYDKNLVMKFEVKVERQTLDRYNLEISQRNNQSFNVFYTSRTALSLI